MRKVFEIGGIVAAAILVAFGVASIVMGVNGRGDSPRAASSTSRSSARPTSHRRDQGRGQGRRSNT